MKPVRPDALRDAVARLSTRRAGTVSQRKVSFTLDEQAVLARVGGSRDLFLDISRLFIEHSKTLLDAVAVATAAGDGQALASSAHALKGSISTFTQAGPYLTAAALEQQAAEGRLDAACALAPRLGDEVAALCAALEMRLSAHELESAS